MSPRLAWLFSALAACGTVSKEPDGATDGMVGGDGSLADATPPPDACPGCPADAPRLVAPTNGDYTGSVLAAASLRPRFRWMAVSGANEYELEVDDSCPIEGFGACAFDSPEAQHRLDVTDFTLPASLPVSSAAPVGRRYFWRARACNATGCGPWSQVRYLLVGQQAADLNGDGFADLVVGAPWNESAGDPSLVDEGMVVIHFGRTSLPATLMAPDVTLVSPVPQNAGHFGLVNGVGDVNADGFGDILITTPAHSDPEGGEGAAYLYYGRPSWTATVTAADVTFDNPRDLAASFMGGTPGGYGDLNADGYHDFVIASLYSSVGATAHVGEAHVWLGGPALPARLDAATTRIENPTGMAETYFGRVAVGDIDADGYHDVLTGSSAFSAPETSEGNVLIFRGRAEWPAVLNAADITIDHPRDAANGGFGASNLACDVDGDGIQDVVSGDSETDPSIATNGKVFVIRGRIEWPADVQTADIELANPRAVDSQYGERNNGCGDVNADGVPDLLISAPNYGDTTIPQSGEAYLYLGGAAFITGAPATTIFASPTLRRSDHFGLPPHAFGDFDADGLTDVAIGGVDSEPPAAPETDNRGRAYLYRGRTSWPATLSSATVNLENPGVDGPGRFGDSTN